MRKSLVVRLVVLGASVALSLLAGEFVVRRAFRDVTTTADNSSFFALRWNAGVALNAHGHREREWTATKPPGTYRIFVLGDSITFGQGLDRQSRYTERLEHELNEGATAGVRFEVLNLGRPGAQTADEQRTLEQLVLPARPDFALLQWFPNDVEGRDFTERPRGMRLLPVSRVDGWLFRNSALYVLASRAWGAIQRGTGLTGSYDEYMLRRFADPAGEPALQADRAVASFVERARSAGVALGLVLFPELGDRAGYEFTFLHERVLERCAAQGLVCVDLAPEFASRPDKRALWVSRLDSHPGDEVHRIAADRLLERFGETWRLAALAAAQHADAVDGQVAE